MGTVTAPAMRIARSATSHSSRVAPKTATRSPGSTAAPRAAAVARNIETRLSGAALDPAPRS